MTETGTLQSSWSSYPRVWNLGHPAVSDLLTHDVVVQEKVDGSQFSFGIIDGRLRTRSKGREIDPPESADNLFTAAVESVREIEGKLVPGVTYRAEYLKTPRHNAVTYSRIPERHLILFDVALGHEDYATSIDGAAEALGLERVPELWRGPGSELTHERFLELLQTESVLGGVPIEGVVVKTTGVFGKDGKPLMGKFVSDAFRETNSKAHKHVGKKDLREELADIFGTPARWAKAVQHLREAGGLEGSPRDIGALLKSASQDIDAECSAEAKEFLWNAVRKDVLRLSVRGLPAWYKEQLLKQQFEAKANG